MWKETNPWDLAWSSDQLQQQFHVSSADLRWLLEHDLVLHRAMRPAFAGNRRQNDSHANKITPHSRFIAKKESLPILRELVVTALSGIDSSPQAEQVTTRPARSRAKPKSIWNPEERELRVGKTLVKKFRRAAPNQELILTAFEEEGWPEWIDDPLPMVKKIQPKQRLKDAVKSLNRQQKNSVLRFYGDFVNGRIQWK